MSIKGRERGKLLTDTAVNTTVQANSPGHASPSALTHLGSLNCRAVTISTVFFKYRRQTTLRERGDDGFEVHLLNLHPLMKAR